MKNLNLIPTDKPSLIAKGEVDNLLAYNKFNPFNSKHWSNQNIYITSDEEIKEGDYMYDIDGDVGKAIGSDMKEFEGNKKIILTTDGDLINDGVQKIDDEFLEWFVKNPKCEEVEVDKDLFQVNQNNPVLKGSTALAEGYKIIIPKEKPNKTHYLDELPNMDREVLAKMWESAMPKLESKQETLEEAAEIIKIINDKLSYKRLKSNLFIASSEAINSHLLAYDSTEENKGFPSMKRFIEGAKWQAERMYNEAIEFGKWLDENTQQREYYPMSEMTMEELFEQFKKN